jgi:His/Glu/Gln/Arg/opine family amino acid ABC transporter permease subunit
MGATMDGPVHVPQEGDSELLDYTLALPPEDPVMPPGRWIKENLFSSKSNTIQTVVFGAILLLLIRWVLSLVFAEEADWTSVATNIKLLFTYNYPAEQFGRIWFATGATAGAAGLSVAAWNLSPAVTVRRIGVGFIGTGGILLVMGAVTPTTTPDKIRIGMFVFGALAAVFGYLAIHSTSEPHIKRVPFTTLLLTISVVVIAIIWLFPFGRYEFLEGERFIASGTANETTKTPWTVTILILLAAFFGGRILGRIVGQRLLRMVMMIWWVIGPAFLIFLVLRDPDFDWSQVLRVDIPGALAFGLIGGALLYAITRPGREETARIVGALLLLLTVGLWVVAFNGWGYDSFPIPLDMQQKFRLSFLALSMFCLMAPTFSGEKSARIRFAGAWIGLVAISHWLITGINTESTLTIVAPPFLGGFVLTVAIAYYVMLASFPLGILLALARTSKMPIFRVMSTLYIEFVRGIPLITVLFFFSIMLNLFLPDGMEIAKLAAVFTGYTVFSAAYMAENIRGGLQSVRKGQYEAADALGLTTVQRTSFIVLPQALRVSIPNLVGQAIATFKETSLIAIVGGFDLLRIADKTIPAQTDFLGQKRPALLFICVVYWVFAYSMSRASRNLEYRLGVGQGR